MGLQERIAEAIIIAVDELGGNPQVAIESALRQPNVEDWIEQEVTKIAFAGGAEMLIPGLHALTIPAGISYLMHKMAYISWGIGALKGAYIVETAHYSDMRNILTLWANDSYYNAHILDHMSLSLELFLHTLSDDGYNELERIEQQLVASQIDNSVVNTIYVLHTLVNEFTGDERSQRMTGTLISQNNLQHLLQTAANRVPSQPPKIVERPLNRRISARLAMGLATRISARVPARLVVGFLPVAGAIINAIFNSQTLRSMADTAIKYYDNQFTQAQLVSLGDTRHAEH